MSGFYPPFPVRRPNRVVGGKPPLVEARQKGGLLIIARCPFCGKRHVHGAGGGYGHRVSHCIGFETPGYVLVSEQVASNEEV